MALNSEDALKASSSIKEAPAGEIRIVAEFYWSASRPIKVLSHDWMRGNLLSMAFPNH